MRAGAVNELARPAAGGGWGDCRDRHERTISGAANLNAFWAMLDAGEDAVREIPAERWEAARHRGDPRREPNTTASIWAGCLEGLDRFDARFFRISPKEAEVMDPQQRILLEDGVGGAGGCGHPAVAAGGLQYRSVHRRVH